MPMPIPMRDQRMSSVTFDPEKYSVSLIVQQTVPLYNHLLYYRLIGELNTAYIR